MTDNDDDLPTFSGDTAAVYAVEEAFNEWAFDYLEEDLLELLHRPLDAEGVEALALAVLRPLLYGDLEMPTFVFDVTDDAWNSGMYDSASDVIHLHPKLTTRRLVLHELAHWMRPRSGHDRQFRGAHLALLRHGVGVEVATALARAYLDAGLDVDWHWTAFSPDEIVELRAGDVR